MAFISKADFTTHIYEENIDTISGDDDAKLDQAINTAMLKARRSLGRYNCDAIFATTDPTEKLKYGELITYIKDIAKYHFIALCNLQVDYEVAEKRYNAACKELKELKSGEDIDGFPLKENETTPAFRSGSNQRIDPYF